MDYKQLIELIAWLAQELKVSRDVTGYYKREKERLEKKLEKQDYAKVENALEEDDGPLSDLKEILDGPGVILTGEMTMEEAKDFFKQIFSGIDLEGDD